MGVYFADYDHQDVLKFEIIEGRFFSRDFPSDSTAILLNEAAVREFGLTNPIGAEIINNDNHREILKVAFVPAAVAAWFVVDSWLSGFAYRVEINPLIFIASGVVATFIAWFTVSFQSIKAASTNPVHSLRYE